MRAFRKRLSTAFVWALVPFTVVSGIPRIGCLCADGQHKLFCGKQLATACCANGAAQSSACPCCHNAGLAKPAKPAACTHCRTPDSPRPDETTVSQTGCTRYFVTPDVPTIQKVVSAPHPLPELAAFDLVPNIRTLSAVAPVREPARDSDLPVPDLLIAHQVFLI